MALSFFHPFESLLFDAGELPISGHSHSNNIRSPNYTTTMSNGVAILTVELPGVRKDCLDLNLKDNVISVLGKRPVTEDSNFAGVSPGNIQDTPNSSQDENRDSPLAKKAGQEHVQEKVITYSAKFKLVYDVDVDGIKADFKDGLLKMKVPRKKESESRKLLVD